MTFQIDHGLTYFNSSYGTVPTYVSNYQKRLLQECESNPYEWFTRTYKDKLGVTKHKLSTYLHSNPKDFVFVDNTSSGANSVFNSISSQCNASSAIIILDIAYGLIVNLAAKYREIYGCVVEIIAINIHNLSEISVSINDKIDELMEKGLKTVLVCIDHISSCPGILLPVMDIAKTCKAQNVPLLVDAAHAIGQVDINLRCLGNAGVCYWISDCHKWFFTPKGCAVLWVREDKQNNIFPVIDCATIGTKGCLVKKNDDSHHLSDFEQRFTYLGTKDYTPWLSVEAAIDFVQEVGGYQALINRNNKLAIYAQNYISHSLQTSSPNCLTSMVNLQLPKKVNSTELASDIMETLRNLYGIYLVVYEYPYQSKQFYIRLCIQLFIEEKDIFYLHDKLLSII